MENKKENRAFNEMYIAAKKRLEGKNPIEIAKNSGAEFDEEKSILKIKSLDAIFELEYPTYDMKEKRDDWQILTLLHYLDLADNTPILSKQIKFGELKDGLIRGARFDKTVEVELERFLKNKDEKHEKRRLGSVHGLLFYLHHRKLSATAFTERRDSSGENTAVPGEYGIFIPLLFSAHGVLYTVFCDM